MTSPPTSRDDGRESRSANGGFLRARLDALSMLSHRVSGVICALAAFTFMWLVMLGLPLIYEARLAKLEQSAGEQLAFEQTTAQAAERVEEANTQQFAEPNPAESQTGQVLIKRCVFEWQACAMLNTVTLGYAFEFALPPSADPDCSLVGTLLSTTTDSNPYICRALLYLAIVVELWALVIGIIYLAHFRYFQNSGESGLWLSHVGPITTDGLADLFLTIGLQKGNMRWLLLIISGSVVHLGAPFLERVAPFICLDPFRGPKYFLVTCPSY